MNRLAALITLALAIMLLFLLSCAPAATGRKYTVAIDASYPPFDMVNTKTGQPEGYSVDLMNAVAARAGLEIEWVNVGFQQLLDGVAACRYDMACSSISITEERRKAMLFSDPVITSGQVITVRADNTGIKSKIDLKGKVVCVQTASTSVAEAQKLLPAELKTYNEIDRVFGSLMEGKCDAVVCDLEVSQYFVDRNPGKMKLAGTAFTDEKDGIAVCKKNESLLPGINAALKTMKEDGTIDKIRNKWLGVK